MQELILMVNPIANKGGARRRTPAVCRNLEAQGWKVRVVVPRSAQATTDFVRQLPQDCLVVALGGDGFIARVCEGALDSQVRVLPLAAGRGNDFCRALNLPENIFETVRMLPALREHRIDIGRANGRVFLGAVSAGFNSIASQWVSDTRLYLGALVYAAGALATFFRVKKPFKYRISVDGKTWEQEAWMADVCLSGRYGGGMQICPESNLEDGQLELVTIEANGRRNLPGVLLDVFNGTILQRPGVKWRRGKRFTLHMNQRTVVHADGDKLGYTPVEVEILPAALTVLAP